MTGIGIDIGGTNTKLLVADEKGNVVSVSRFPTEAEKGPEDFVKRLSSAVAKIKKENNVSPLAIGIGAAGDADPETGVLRYAPNLKWRNVPLTGPISEATGLPCVMENDANMAAWGAYVMELGRKPCNALVLTMGTGIGSGIIINGSLYHGATGTAGEAGHLTLEQGGRLCNCGRRGCLEAYCGSVGIMRRAAEAIPDQEAFIKKYNPGGIFDPYTLSKAYEAGDSAAIKLWHDTGRYLGEGLANLILLFNPHYVVLTGGVSKSRDKFLPAMKEVFKGQPISTPFEKLEIRASDNPELGSIGSALFGLEQL
ncbi:MAG: ROK family protein [Elusimicrobiales bacterium]|nr:ROK family protein [Elusimicrobiales bacterium]